jgi:Domain of unknown function (DUF397)
MTTEPKPHSTLAWRTSSASGGSGECVEVAQLESSVLIRDSRDRSGPILMVNAVQWIGLLERTRKGNIGLP